MKIGTSSFSQGKYEKLVRGREMDSKVHKTDITCLVTGASGFVGSHMVKLLLENGYNVKATDLTEDCSLLDPGQITENFSYHCVDLLDSAAVHDLMNGVNWVFHIAGIFRFEAGLDSLINANVHVVENMVKAAKDHNIETFIHFSTTGVYGSCEREGCIDETKKPSPDNNYEISKYLGEKIVDKAIREDNFPAAIIRPTLIYGSGSIYGPLYNAINNIFGALWKKYVRKNQIYSPINLNVSREWLYYLLTDHEYSNEHLKSTGYQLKHPDFYRSIKENVEWLKQNNYIKI